jgi:hypothetical protein
MFPVVLGSEGVVWRSEFTDVTLGSVQIAHLNVSSAVTC